MQIKAFLASEEQYLGLLKNVSSSPNQWEKAKTVSRGSWFALCEQSYSQPKLIPYAIAQSYIAQTSKLKNTILKYFINQDGQWQEY